MTRGRTGKQTKTLMDSTGQERQQFPLSIYEDPRIYVTCLISQPLAARTKHFFKTKR